MKAAWYDRNGAAADVLQVGEQPVQEPGDNDVVVRVVCSGVNPSDAKSRAGSRPVKEGIIIPHSDAAGVIERVGRSVDPQRVGQRVWLWNAQYNRPYGAAAEYISLPSEQAVLLPDHISFEAGACLGIPALTAYRGIELAELGPDTSVLVIGGSSAVGFYAAQMARAQGATVITTVGSQEKADFMVEHGFEHNILYKTESVADRVRALTDGKGVNAIIDMDFSTSVRLVDEGVLASHGHFVCYGSNDRGGIPLTFAAWLPRSISLHFYLVYELTPPQRKRAVEGLQALLEANALTHHIGPRFPLQDIVQAHEAVERGAFGKVIVDSGK
jgi:NADPH:quinone reductase and related Zn-dependent oxidoreductases